MRRVWDTRTWVTLWPEVSGKGEGGSATNPHCSGNHSGGLAEPQDSVSVGVDAGGLGQAGAGGGGQVCSVHTGWTSAPGDPHEAGAAANGAGPGAQVVMLFPTKTQEWQHGWGPQPTGQDRVKKFLHTRTPQAHTRGQ